MKKLYRIPLFAILGALVSHFSYAQTCEKSSKQSAPTNRYQIVAASNGAEVLDKRTGLIWQRCSMGQFWNGSTCSGEPTRYTWIEALKKTQALGNGYRLPNIKELQTLVEDSCTNPAINQSIFPATDIYSTYLTSSPQTVHKQEVFYNHSNIWLVEFSTGSSWSGGSKSDKSFAIRAVRNSK